MSVEDVRPSWWLESASLVYRKNGSPRRIIIAFPFSLVFTNPFKLATNNGLKVALAICCQCYICRPIGFTIKRLNSVFIRLDTELGTEDIRKAVDQNQKQNIPRIQPLLHPH